MKVTAILLMLLGILLIGGMGFMYLLVFAMSFDAPGSESDIKAWWLRLLMFLPILFLVAVLIFAWRAYSRGNYVRSVRIGLIFIIVGVGGFLLLSFQSYSTMRDFRAFEAQEAEYIRLYPEQRFLRPVERGVDTIIVFPNRIVAYRIIGPDFPLSGPVGDLNEQRDTIVYYRSIHNDISIDELYQFVDEQGRKITDVYAIK